MTTEVVILNKLAVALAADSAVTISGIDPSDTKVYNSTNKLFSLSKYHPVGIMVYGNASFMEVPWETIIKMFREKLGTEEKSCLKDYWEALLSFLENDFFSQDDQEKYFMSKIKEVFTFVRKRAEESIDKKKETSGNVSKKEINLCLESAICEVCDVLSGHDYLQEMNSEVMEARFKETYLEKIRRLAIECFEQLPLYKAQKNKLNEIAWLLASRDFSPQSSGIAIAGFGKSEIFPSCYTYELDCIVAGKLKGKAKENYSISVKESGAGIIPLAQENIIRTFIYGIDPEIEQSYMKSLSQECKNLTEAIIKEVESIGIKQEHTKLLHVLIEKKTHELISNHEKKMQKSKLHSHTRPILNAVQFLPKDELAAMAEALVNITSVKQKVSLSGVETVGGPVDVAVISKGDGFIWIKRKHYFDPHLNHHFFKNYFSGS